MRIRFLFIFPIIIFSGTLYSQSSSPSITKFTIHGYVEDSATGEKLPGAAVLLPDLKTGTVTNNYGFFTITLKSGAVSVIFSYAGYKPLQQEIVLNKDQELLIKLEANTNLGEVVVVSKKTAPIQEQTQMSKISVPVALIKSMPRFLGETDVLKTLQLLPGVSQGAEGTSGVLVRGGSPDQNLILLDGTPVYNPSHLFGIFSSFNGDALKSVDLYKGGFPARFGGRLSSVIDLVMKDGNMKEFHGEGAIGLLASRLTLEGPIKKGKTSFLISGRRSYLDLLAGPIVKRASEGDITGFGAYFYDLNVKLHHIFSPKDRLFASFFSGQDFFKLKANFSDGSYEEKSKIRIGWGNTIGTLRWNHVFNKKLFANTLFNYTQYRFVTDASYEIKDMDDRDAFDARYFSGIYDVGARIDFDFRPLPEQNIRFGISALQHVFTPGAATIKIGDPAAPDIDTSFNKYNQRSMEMAVYAEDDWQIIKKLKVNIGVHASAFKAKTKWYSSLQPRLGLRYLLPGDIAFKASYTHMNQYVHLLTNNSTTLPTDLWVPSTDNVKPMFSRQIAAGFAKSVMQDKVEVSVEGYYKTMDGVIEYKDGASYLNSTTADWDTKVESGKAKSYGIELMLQKKLGKTTGWIGYTLSWSKRQFPEINFGREFFYKYDRRHDLEVAITHKLGKRWEISGSWQFQTGSPFTLPVAQYEGAIDDSPWDNPYYYNEPVEHIKGRNAFRLLNYHRLDVGITWKKQKKHHEKSWNFSLYNAYNRQNPFYYYFDRYNNNTGKTVLKGVTLLPLVPSISYGFKF
ncbi:MAG: TonB-dependent receptor [Sphingobacteriales bacterium]|nr:TonB-dependent receptor [Sphingobacteriales bacterium]